MATAGTGTGGGINMDALKGIQIPAKGRYVAQGKRAWSQVWGTYGSQWIGNHTDELVAAFNTLDSTAFYAKMDKLRLRFLKEVKANLKTAGATGRTGRNLRRVGGNVENAGVNGGH